MDLTVIVSTYNRARSLSDTLGALCAQVVPDDLRWELIVVDNNSSDATPAVVEAVQPTAPMPVRYVFEPRQGVSFGRNAGIEQARGAIIACTDDDVLPAPDWVGMVPQVMREWGADTVGGRIRPKWARPAPAWLANAKRLHNNLALIEHDQPAQLRSPVGSPPIWGANMAFTRDILARVGTFDTRRGTQGGKLYGGEEPELIGRVIDNGGKVVFDPRLIVWHQIGPERMRRRYFFRWHFQSGEGEARLERSGGPRALLGAPHHRYRQAATAAAGWLLAAACRRPDAMNRGLEACRAAGRLWGHWRRYFTERREASS